MKTQNQFLDVVDCDSACRRFWDALRPQPLDAQQVPIEHARGRILAADVVATIDVPGFDRSNFDGFAVRAEDVIGADENKPMRLRLLEETAVAGRPTGVVVESGTAMAIATGGVMPRGADAIVMVEDTTCDHDLLSVLRSVYAGFGITFAGTDISGGERVLLQGTKLTSRETGVIAALGCDTVSVVRQPRIAVISTGDEIRPPGETLAVGEIYDSNARVLADALTELGAEPVPMGIVDDDRARLFDVVSEAIAGCDGVLLSGGTSKGAGDISYQVVYELAKVCAHGVAIKPGKPICLAAAGRKPVVVLPGFPTSAVFTFHEFVAPVIRRLGGLNQTVPSDVDFAELAVGVRSEIGRKEYLLVSLVQQRADAKTPLAAYPLGKGSGSVTTFGHADGFVAIEQRTELVESGTIVPVQRISKDLPIADLMVLGSHCVGLEWLLSCLSRDGHRVRFLAVGSTAGLDAVKKGRCDLAGMHLLDPESGTYNTPYLNDDLLRIPGYRRMQGIVFREGDDRFAGRELQEIVATIPSDESCRMVNRNQGSGTRILIDDLLQGAKPPGYAIQPRTHHAVVAAIQQGRADWGLALESVAKQSETGFLPLRTEVYDFVIRRSERNSEAVVAFGDLLAESDTQAHLLTMGLAACED